VLCVGLAVVLTTESSVRGAKTEETPYETVRTASHFAIGGVGVAGTITPEELAMRKIRDGPQSEQQLRSLIREGTPAGQMYALFALRQLKTADYVTLSAPYRQNSLSVPTISGCIIHTQTMSEAVRWIDQYAIKMRTWEQSRVAPQKSSGLHINSAQPGAS
jgi:hypothetical protein